MKQYWLREQNTKKTLQLSLEKSSEKLADYFTKKILATYHKTIRCKYVTDF